MRCEPTNITFDYVNWKGNRVTRHVEARGVRFGTSEYYPEPGWLLDGIDTDKNVERTYKMSNMTNVIGAEA